MVIFQFLADRYRTDILVDEQFRWTNIWFWKAEHTHKF